MSAPKRLPPASEKSAYRELLAPLKHTTDTVLDITRQVCPRLVKLLLSAIETTEAVAESAGIRLTEGESSGLASAADKANRVFAIATRLESCARIAQSLNWSVVDCDQTLRLISQDLRDTLADTDARIVWENLPQIRSVEGVLPVIFQELIINAVNNRSADRMEVVVRASRADSGWTFSVEDNGVGIDRKYWQAVFDPFFTVDPRTWRPGLGLTVVRLAVEHLGGGIHVEASDRGGSQFKFVLPGSCLFPN